MQTSILATLQTWLKRVIQPSLSHLSQHTAGHSGLDDRLCQAQFANSPMVNCWRVHDQTIRLWNAHDGSCLTVLQGHTGGVTLSALVPMDRFWPVPATTPRSDCGVLIAAPLKTLSGHTSWVCCLQPGWSNLASGGEDRTIRLWE